jgi:hypothetical protein
MRTLKGARVEFEGSRTFDVTIRDMSEGGVKLKLGSPFALPKAFTLVIHNPNTGIAEKRSCELRWQRGDQAGAQFTNVEIQGTAAGVRPANLRRPIAPT